MSLLEHVKFYREQGISIIPVPAKTKEAKIKWAEYRERLPTDSEINSWFNGNNTNVAALTGKPPGGKYSLVVLDCDSSERFYEVAAVITSKLGVADILDFTLVSQTGRGYHILLWVKAPVKSAKFPNLDIKGEGGYILVPPSIHPNGMPYKFLNPKVPISVIDSLSDIGIDLERKPQGQIGDKPNWISEVLQHGADEGRRNDTCFRLAGYFKERQPRDITTQILLDWNQKNRPPLSEKEVITAVDSAYTYAVNPLTYLNSKRDDFPSKNTFCLESGQVSGQVVDKLREHGELALPFDNFLKENPEPHWKKDVAEAIGTIYKDQAFIKLVQRRAKEGMIKISHGGDKIQWVNKDWQRSKISLEAGKREFLGLSLPFGAEKYIATPEHCQIVVAGDVGSGKTHYGYHLADLNVGKIQIRHFVNEIGESKAIKNLDDFPHLQKFFDNGYVLINQDKEQLDVAENIDPNGLNIYDYLHLPSTKEWFLWLQKELARLSQKLEAGVIVVMLQKKRGTGLAMGGDSTRMQCETYISLNIEKDVRGSENEHGYKVGRVDIVKCKDWASSINPEVLSCRYRTAPKHGKLVADSEGWFEKKED